MSSKPNINSFILKIILQACIFVVALSVRDTIQTSLNLIPIPTHTILLQWVQALLHLLIIVIILSFLVRYKFVDSSIMI
jgi:hypothetical protein